MYLHLSCFILKYIYIYINIHMLNYHFFWTAYRIPDANSARDTVLRLWSMKPHKSLSWGISWIGGVKTHISGKKTWENKIFEDSWYWYVVYYMYIFLLEIKRWYILFGTWVGEEIWRWLTSWKKAGCPQLWWDSCPPTQIHASSWSRFETSSARGLWNFEGCYGLSWDGRGRKKTHKIKSSSYTAILTVAFAALMVYRWLGIPPSSTYMSAFKCLQMIPEFHHWGALAKDSP